MKIAITRKGGRYRLSCFRADGSSTSADAGPGLPHHDLCHFVVERRFGLARGFFGNIAAGRTIAELGEKDVILSLPPESLRAEILARALGSLATGACRADQFEELVNTELAQWKIGEMAIAPGEAEKLLGELEGLLGRLGMLEDGESLTLEFGQVD
jgi:hypothetical protein